MSENKYKFYTFRSTPWGQNCVVTAAGEKEGFIFTNEGVALESNLKLSPFYAISRCQAQPENFKEIPFSQAVKLIKSGSRTKFCEFLKLEMPNPDVVKYKDKILTLLKESRAFNADAAIQLSDYYDDCCSLVEQNIIKSVTFKQNGEEYFYLDGEPVQQNLEIVAR